MSKDLTEGSIPEIIKKMALPVLMMFLSYEAYRGELRNALIGYRPGAGQRSVEGRVPEDVSFSN